MTGHCCILKCGIICGVDRDRLVELKRNYDSQNMFSKFVDWTGLEGDLKGVAQLHIGLQMESRYSLIQSIIEAVQLPVPSHVPKPSERLSVRVW